MAKLKWKKDRSHHNARVGGLLTLCVVEIGGGDAKWKVSGHGRWNVVDTIDIAKSAAVSCAREVLSAALAELGAEKSGGAR